MMNNKSLTVIDMLSIICFYLTIETMDDINIIEDYLQRQDQKLNKILEVLKNDNR